jgi:hypothetical protein
MWAALVKKALFNLTCNSSLLSLSVVFGILCADFAHADFLEDISSTSTEDAISSLKINYRIKIIHVTIIWSKLSISTN